MDAAERCPQSCMHNACLHMSMQCKIHFHAIAGQDSTLSSSYIYQALLDLGTLSGVHQVRAWAGLQGAAAAAVQG